MEGKYARGNPPRSAADYIREGKSPPRRKPKYLKKRRRRRLNPRFVALCIFALTLVLVLVSCIARLGNDAPKETTPPTNAPTELQTEPPMSITGTASITAGGDVMSHMPVVNSVYDSASGTYDFTGIFEYLDDYIAEADYAAANLETTLAGKDNGYAYSGYPCFNCPDEIADAMKAAGFDMMLTANNHCYDTRTVGLTRTLQIADELGLDTLGTQATAGEDDHLIKTVNGIRIGMICYTYATGDSYPDIPSLNGILVDSNAVDYVNYFDLDQLDTFYAKVENSIAGLEAAGAEAIVMYIHWGDEYQLSPNTYQTAIAQKLCDLGVDVIAGGHSHTVQPVKLLTSTVDESHKTVCLYSMGNMISNQQRIHMNLNTGHTEDGVLFSFSFARYSDGEVLLDSVDILPFWVYRKSAGNSYVYRLLPLDKEVTDWAAAYGIDSSVVASAQESYERTMGIVGSGLTEAQDYLAGLREAKLNSQP